MTAHFQLVPAGQVADADLHQAFGTAFADYLIGPFQLTLAQWPVFLARQAISLNDSRVALRDGAIAAFAFTAPRPSLASWRLGTMGAVPQARGTGVAGLLLDDFITRAKAAGLRRVELECFAQNERGLRLYQGRGFETIAPLYGYSLAAAGAGSESGGDEVSLADAYDWLDASGDLPLQVTRASLQALPVALRARRRGQAQVVYSQAADGAVTLHSLVDRDAAQAEAEALVGGLLREMKGCRFSVPQLQLPHAGGDALVRLGFERLPLHQVWMRRAL
jgi:ribosomal protein S18 acetylase RimI-like enzyme